MGLGIVFFVAFMAFNVIVVFPRVPFMAAKSLAYPVDNILHVKG